MDAPSDLGSPGAASAPNPPEGPPGPRRLRRRPDDGHIAGVCAGVAEYFNVDPMLVRIAAVVLAFSGPGLIAYVLAWIFVPADPGLAHYSEPQPPIDRTDRATQIFGIVLLGLGVSVIWGDWWSPLKGWLFPIGLIALGGWLLLRPDRDDPPSSPPVPPVPPAPPVPPVPPTATTTPWSWPAASTVTEPAPTSTPVADEPTDAEPPETDPSDADPWIDLLAPDPTLIDDGDAGTADPTTVQPTTLAGADGTGGGGGQPPAPWDVPPAPVPGGAPAREDRHERNHRRRHRHLVGPGVFGVLLIWTGIAWLTGVGLTTGLAVGLVILGLGFVLGSFVGGSRALILPALVVAVALAISAFVDIPLAGPIGDQQWSPDAIAELQDEYEVSMGEGTLDLTGLDELRTDTTVRATVGLGHLVVLVRPDQDLLIDTETGAGDVVVLGEEQNGIGFETHEAYDGDGATLTLDLEVGLGQIEVRYGISRDRGDRVDPPEPTEAPEPTTPSTLG